VFPRGLIPPHREVPFPAAGWRYRGYGPVGIKAGGRVLCSLAELERWDTEQAVAGAERATRRQPA